MESEMVFISDVEFANIVQELNLLKQFRGKKIPNQFEIVTREVVASKHENVQLDFKNCSAKERIEA